MSRPASTTSLTSTFRPGAVAAADLLRPADTDPDLIEISNVNGVMISRDQDDDSLIVSIEKGTAEADYPVIPDSYVLADAETDRDGTLYQTYEVRPAVRRILDQAHADGASYAYWVGLLSGSARGYLDDPTEYTRQFLADVLAAERITNGRPVA